MELDPPLNVMSVKDRLKYISELSLKMLKIVDSSAMSEPKKLRCWSIRGEIDAIINGIVDNI